MSENRTIARARKIIQTRLDKVNADYTDARMCWLETGYRRYQNKMERLEAERDELESWAQVRALMELRSENSRLRRQISELEFSVGTLRNLINTLSERYPDDEDVRGLWRLIGEIRESG